MDELARKLKTDLRLKDTIMTTFIIGFIAHAFVFFNPYYGDDNVTVAMARAYNSATGTRWLQSFFAELTSFANASVVSGLLVLSFLAISSFLVIDIFGIRERLTCYLIVGLMVINPAITYTNFFELPYLIIIALPFALLGIWMICRYQTDKIWKNVLLSSFFVMLTAATYGVYVSIYTTLACLLVVLDILKGKKLKDNIGNIFKYVISFAIGMILYYMILRLFLYFGNMQLNQYAGEEALTDFSGFSPYVYGLTRGYVHFFYYILGIKGYSFVPSILSIGLVVLGVFFSFMLLKKHENTAGNLVLLLFCLLVLPICVNIIWVLSGGNTYGMMYVSNIYVYIFVVVLLESTYKTNQKLLNKLAIVLLCVFVYYGVLLSNTCYTKIDNMYTRTQSIATRLVDRIECNYTGTEDVILIGTIYGYTDYFAPPYSSSLDFTTGMRYADPNMGNLFSYGQLLYLHLTNITGANLQYQSFSSKEEALDAYKTELSVEDVQTIKEMGHFPEKSSVQKIGNHILVYLYLDSD